jgi:hypothetical protein
VAVAISVTQLVRDPPNVLLLDEPTNDLDVDTLPITFSVPEPAVALLHSTALGCLGWLVRRRRRTSSLPI